eukprot:TRINITY_DN50794_c0_g1_i1.p1 TRINITY_DN50794_c0_g1~~TRINITY_DN50794_c0_g1_i1.p1  ORF type:complete len:390 (+),score=35.43 TRINITY_DN50794_c0_g1_i1:276-1445(+)
MLNSLQMHVALVHRVVVFALVLCRGGFVEAIDELVGMGRHSSFPAQPVSMRRSYQRGVCGRGRVHEPRDGGFSLWASHHSSAWRKRVLVHPPSKFAFCLIAKVGSSRFAWLFNDLNGFFNNRSRCCGSVQRLGHEDTVPTCYADSAAGRYNLTRPKWTADSDWNAAAFVRDPLERFLSAFLMMAEGDRCARNWTRHASCLDNGRTFPGENASKELLEEDSIRSWDRLVFVGLRLRTHRRRLERDAHFQTQYDSIFNHCKFSPNHMRIGHLTANRLEVHNQMVELLHPLVLSRELLGHFLAWHFPVVGYTDLGAYMHSQKTHAKLLKYYHSKEIVDAVMKYVGVDYVKFRIPLPEWLGQVPSSSEATASRTEKPLPLRGIRHTKAGVRAI